MTVELFVAAAVTAAIVLAILIGTAPRERGNHGLEALTPHRDHDPVQALNDFGDDADRIFR